MTNIIALADDINADAQTLPTSVTDVLQEVDDFIQLFLDTVERIVDPDRLATQVTEFIEDVIDRLTFLVENNMGPCALLVGAYDSVVQASCDDAQDSLDAYWFAIAWVSFMAIVLIILSIKASDAGRSA